MTQELRTAGDVASWLAVGLMASRVTSDASEQIVLRALGACAHELPGLPPPGVIADVALLLEGARLPSGMPVSLPEPLRGAIRAYDDDVLARLVTTARFDDVVAAYAHIGEHDRPAAIALVIGAISERTQFTGQSVSAALIRRAVACPRDEREALGRAAMTNPETVEQLADAYQQLARGARHTRALVDDRELFAIDHIAVLRDLGGRMTADHIAAAAEALARRLPRRLPADRANRGARTTQLPDDSSYPAGGFAAITPGGATTGNIENLVTSELMYMEDGADVDVFSLRYIEGELLHYTRDDSVFRRHRHVIAIVLDADLELARVKDRVLPWQRLVLTLGLVVAAIRWLVDQLGDEALTIQLAFPPQLLAEESTIVALLLEAEVARGVVAVSRQPPSDVIALAESAMDTAIADLVVLSTGSVPVLAKGLRVLHVNVGAAAPTVSELAPRRGGPAEPSADAWAEWCGGAEDLLRWLV
ncbi:MAG: hypothetical protein AB7O24_02980 [Kofleriaceae bacterium]